MQFLFSAPFQPHFFLISQHPLSFSITGKACVIITYLFLSTKQAFLIMVKRKHHGGQGQGSQDHGSQLQNGQGQGGQGHGGLLQGGQG